MMIMDATFMSMTCGSIGIVYYVKLTTINSGNKYTIDPQYVLNTSLSRFKHIASVKQPNARRG